MGTKNVNSSETRQDCWDRKSSRHRSPAGDEGEHCFKLDAQSSCRAEATDFNVFQRNYPAAEPQTLAVAICRNGMHFQIQNSGMS